MSDQTGSTGTEGQSFWQRWISGPPETQARQSSSDSSSLEQHDEGFLKRYMPAWFFAQENIQITDKTSYHQLTKKQVKILENEAEQSILKGHDTWCWFNQTMNSKNLDMDGVLSVFNTGSATCPLPLVKYPLLLPSSSKKVMLKNSMIIPGVAPTEYLHELPLKTKLANAVKNHYNFPCEKHMYLKQHLQNSFEDANNIIVISLHGSLPDKYEKATVGHLPSSLHLNSEMLKALLPLEPQRVSTFSIECPLDVKHTSIVLNEVVSLLRNWNHIFCDCTRIFIIGTYHSVPLSFFLAQSILNDFGLTKLKSIGILGIDSCLQGYQFWDHSAEITPQSMENPSFQQAKEKGLFDGSSKLQQEVLSSIRNYRDPGSDESKEVLRVLDELLFHHPHIRVTLLGKLYHNFLTISQSLAIDYIHPLIQRRLWCDGNNMNLGYRSLKEVLPNKTIDKLNQEFKVPIPKEREFEVTLINNLLLALNLGHTEFIPLMKELGPFFISRSFNEFTCPGPLKKQLQGELKSWLQERDSKWKDLLPSNSNEDELLPQDINTYSEAFDYIYYRSQRFPDQISLKTSIYDDTSIYEGFVYDTLLTANIQAPKHLVIHHAGNGKVFNRINEYNVVWNFHEAMGAFLQIRNLPSNIADPSITAMIAADNMKNHWFSPAKASFPKSQTEAYNRLNEIWQTYQTWNPSTTGLRQLKKVFSVLQLYDSGQQLQKEVSIM